MNGVTKCYRNGNIHPADQAVSVCASLGGKLPSPSNSNEFHDLIPVVTGVLGLSMHSIILDGSDKNAEGTWVTSTNANVPYLEWNTDPNGTPLEPNGGTLENCLQMLNHLNIHKMNDIGCSHSENVICEKG